MHADTFSHCLQMQAADRESMWIRKILSATDQMRQRDTCNASSLFVDVRLCISLFFLRELSTYPACLQYPVRLVCPDEALLWLNEDLLTAKVPSGGYLEAVV